MGADELILPEKFDIEGLIRQAAARAGEQETANEPEGDGLPTLEQLSPLPRPGDPYKAFSRPSNKQLPTLSLLKSDGTSWSYPYSCRVEGPHVVPANDAASNLVVLIKFSGLTGIEVTGHQLDAMSNYIAHQRIAWVREMPKGKFPPEPNAPVVTGIFVKTLEG
jgi:hypothetical protein